MHQSWEDTLRTVKRRLGAVLQIIKVDDEFITEVIKEETFSQIAKYYPKQIYWSINTQADKSPVANQFYLKVPDQIEIVGIQEVYDYGLNISGVSPGSYIDSNVMDAQLQLNLNSFMVVPQFAEFIKPNKVELSNANFSSQDITFKLDIKQISPNTLKGGIYEHFKDLATADVAKAAIASHKVFSSVQTPFGDVTVDYSILEDYAGRRDDYLDKLLNNRVKSYPKKVWIY